MNRLSDLKIKKVSHSPQNLQPFLLLSPSENKLIVLLHGLSSYPWEMSFLGQFLNNHHFSVYAPLISDFYSFLSFKKFSYQIWLDKINSIFKELSSHTREVIVIGHSLGGLLAVYSALHFPIVSKIVLVNTVFKLKNPFIGFLPLLFPFWKGLKIKTKPEYQNNYYPYFPVQSIYELYKLSNYVRKSVSQLNLPVYIIASKSDKTISLQAVKKVYDQIPSEKKLKIYTKAPHSILTPIYKNRVQVYEEILNFIS